MSISWPPIASISSRMICTTFWCTRQPSGRNVQTPALTWRMIAAADEQLVRDGLRICRRFAQGGDEQRGLASDHRCPPRLVECGSGESVLSGKIGL